MASRTVAAAGGSLDVPARAVAERSKDWQWMRARLPAQAEVAAGPLQGQTVVLTGTLASMGREAAKEFLVHEGYDPAYGARPLKRAIQRQLLDPLAMRVLQGEFGEGARITVDLGDNGLTFHG